MATGEKGNQMTTQNPNTPKRWVPPNRPLTIADVRERRAFNKAADKASKAMESPASEAQTQLNSIDNKNRAESHIGPQAIGKKDLTAITYSNKLADSRLNKWHFRLSCAAVIALLILWLQPILSAIYLRWDSTESALSIAFGLIFLAVFVGVPLGAGPFFVLRAYFRHPKQLELAYRRSEWDNFCKKHARGHCRTCLRWYWIIRQAWAWASVALLYYLAVGTLPLGSDHFEIKYIPLALSTVCGLFLWISVSSPDMFHFSPDRPLELHWGIINAPKRGERRVPQLILILSWIILLSISLWSHDIGLLRITITSMTLYFIAVFWGIKSHTLSQDLMVSVKRLGQRAARYRDEAMQGDARARFRYGLLYEEGNGVQIDLPEAISWYRKAAEQGLADAQVKLGEMYYHGSTVPCDYAQAMVWFRKAAEQGNAVALTSLGLMYAFGPNEMKAASWYNDTIFNGDMVAQQAYAGMLYAATKESKNYLEGYFWLCLATEMGSSDVMDRDEIAAKLSPAERSGVQEKVTRWLAEHRRN